MKRSWSTRALSDLCIIVNGLWIGKKPPFTRVGVIRNTNFGSDGLLNDSDVAYLDVEKRQLVSRHLEYGDIILEKSGGGPKQPVGRVVLFDKHSDLFSFSKFTSAFRVLDSSSLDFQFLHKFLYWLHLSGVTEAMQTHSTGIRNLDVNEYKKVQVPLPPLPEQRRILNILGNSFHAIATATASTKANLANARAIFDDEVATIFAKPDHDWVQRSLKDISVDFGRGRSRHRPRNDVALYGGTFPFIQTGDIRSADHFVHTYSQTYNQAGLAQSKLWPKGTVCITIAANIAETAVLTFDACFPDSIIGCVVNEKLANPQFLKYLLQSFKAVLKAQGKGSAQDNINLSTFEKRTFPFPGRSVQNVIVDRLDALRHETSQLEMVYRNKLAALHDVKQSLLYAAFSGELTAREANVA